VLALGSRRPRELELPGRELSGVVQAMDYLERANRAVASGGFVEEPFTAKGKRVVILGGGDTGSDCLGTSLRQGARSVVQAELQPMPPAERDANNPWPQWPMIFRTSSSQEEGGAREFGFRTTAFRGANGKLSALEAVHAHDGSALSMEVELVLLSLGFLGPDTRALSQQLGVALDVRGNIAVDASFATSASGVWAAGDCHRGASLIVWAIAEGRETAHHVDAALRKGASTLPTRGADLAF